VSDSYDPYGPTDECMRCKQKFPIEELLHCGKCVSFWAFTCFRCAQYRDVYRPYGPYPNIVKMSDYRCSKCDGFLGYPDRIG